MDVVFIDRVEALGKRSENITLTMLGPNLISGQTFVTHISLGSPSPS